MDWFECCRDLSTFLQYFIVKNILRTDIGNLPLKSCRFTISVEGNARSAMRIAVFWIGSISLILFHDALNQTTRTS